MNKKLITTVAIAVAAVIVIVLAVFAVIKGIKPANKPQEDDPSSQISSQGTDSGVENDKTPDSGTENGGGSQNTDSEGQISETASTVETHKGKIVEVPVVIKDNPGIVMANFDVEYDAQKFEYTGYKGGTLFKDYEINAAQKGKITLVVYSNDKLWSDTNSNGTVITLKFKVKDNVEAGEYAVTVKRPAGDVMLINAAEQEVSANLFAKAIVVK